MIRNLCCPKFSATNIAQAMAVSMFIYATVISAAPAKPENEKRSFDALTSRGFSGFDKRAFDSFSGAGFTGFDKRSPSPSMERGFDKRSFDSFMGPGFSGMDKRSFDSLNGRGFSGFDKRSFDSFSGAGFTGFDKRSPGHSKLYKRPFDVLSADF